MNEFFHVFLLTWGMVFVRSFSALVFVPPFGHQAIPFAFRLGGAAVIACPLAYAMAEDIDRYPSVIRGVELIGWNIVAGLLVGGCTAAVFFGAVMAGRYIDGAAGWCADRTIHPGRDLTNILAAALFISMDGHHAVIAAIAGSCTCLPLFEPDCGILRGQELLALPAKMFVASLLIAAPALLAILLARLLLCITERVYSEVAQVGLGNIAPALISLFCYVAALPAVVCICVAQLRYCLDALAVTLQ